MLPDWLKKLLEAVGLNPIRIEWKLRFLRERLRWERTSLARWAKILSYEHKFCSCGQLVHKDAKTCPQCGQTLSSRALYRVGRLLGFVTPEVGLVWTVLLLVICAVFLVEFRFGVMIGADNAGHVGGLVAGGVLGFIVPTDARQKAQLVALWRVLAAGCLAAWAYTLFMMWRSVSA